jgi:hypothetical protein
MPRYKLTVYRQIVTPESAEEGDYDHDLSDGPEDGDESELCLNDLIHRLNRESLEPSIQPWNRGSLRPGAWLTSYPEEDYVTGNSETRSYHISLTSGREITSRELARIWRLAGVQGEQR